MSATVGRVHHLYKTVAHTRSIPAAGRVGHRSATVAVARPQCLSLRHLKSRLEISLTNPTDRQPRFRPLSGLQVKAVYIDTILLSRLKYIYKRKFQAFLKLNFL
jgi:hypothetical protein